MCESTLQRLKYELSIIKQRVKLHSDCLLGCTYNFQKMEELLDEAIEEKRKDQEELDSWMDALEAEILQPQVLDALRKAR